MDTPTAILLTQIPIALAILVGVIEFYRTKKELVGLLEKISEKK